MILDLSLLYMEPSKIKKILNDNIDLIKAKQTFKDRLTIIYDILDKSFPKTSAVSAIYGPITNMGDYMSRYEIEQLLEAIKYSMTIDQECCSPDLGFNSVLEVIYNFAKSTEC